MNIFKLLQKILMASVLSYALDGENWGWSDDSNGSDGWDGSDGGDNWSNGSDWDDGWNDKNDWKSGSDDWDSPENRFKRFKISQAKKEVAKKVANWEDPSWANLKKEDLNNDQDFQKLVDDIVAEKISKLDLWDNSKINDIEARLEKDDFFNQLKDAGKIHSEYWMSVDTVKAGEILADIEENGFKPDDLILLQNKDFIMSKLKGLPRSPTNTDGWAKPKIDTNGMSMTDRIKAMREKHSR